MKVDISGVDKGALLAELFNGSSVRGMGVLQATRGPAVMSHEQGRELIERTLKGEFADDNGMVFKMRINPKSVLSFDYLFGRPLKVDLITDEVDPWGYDRDNGGDGVLQRIVDRLREA